MVVQTHTQNFSTLGQLESVQKLGELLRSLIMIGMGVLGPPGVSRAPNFKKSKKAHTERWSKHTSQNFSTLAQL